jgi:UDP-glucose:(heptosyl)LPS alpha-1,3-glucosyltransferase
VRLALIVYRMFPHGGRQRFALQLVQSLQAAGHTCRLYTASWEGLPPAACEVRLVPARAVRRHRWQQRFHAWVQRDLANDPVDGVVGLEPMPDLDILLAFDDCFLDTALRQRSALYRRGAAYAHHLRFERSAVAPPSRALVLVQSEAQGLVFVQHYGTEAGRIDTLAPAVTADRFAGPDAASRRENTRAAFALDQRDITLLFIGNAFADKGLDRAIHALAHLRDEVPNAETRLLVVGEDARSRFLRLARRLRVADAVEFLGPRDDVPDLLLAADVLVHPAIAEAGGLVLLEAMAAGLPVLTTSIPGYAPRVAQAEAGIVLREPYSQRQMNDALRRFLASRFRSECGANGLRAANASDFSYGPGQAVATLERVLQKKR